MQNNRRTRLQEAIDKEVYKHDLFPWILHYLEQSDSFEYVAEQLNNDGVPTWRGKLWCRQNIEKTFKDYWRTRGGIYSWQKHGQQISAMQDALDMSPTTATANAAA